MKISDFLIKMATEGICSPDETWDQFSEAALVLDLPRQYADGALSDASTELFDSHAANLWQELGGVGSPNVDRASAIARASQREPRRVGTGLVGEDEDVDFSIPPDLELAIASKAQTFASELCRVYRTHAVNAARQGIADVNASILESLQ